MRHATKGRLLSLLAAFGCILLPHNLPDQAFSDEATGFLEMEAPAEDHGMTPDPPLSFEDEVLPVEILQPDTEHPAPPATTDTGPEPVTQPEPPAHTDIAAVPLDGHIVGAGQAGGPVNLFVPIRFLLSDVAVDTNTDASGQFVPPGEDYSRYTQVLSDVIDWATLTLQVDGAADSLFGAMPSFFDTATLIQDGTNHGYVTFYNMPLQQGLSTGMYPVSLRLHYQLRGEDFPREVWLSALLDVSAYDVEEGFLQIADAEEVVAQILEMAQETPEPHATFAPASAESILLVPDASVPEISAVVPPAPVPAHQKALTIVLDETLYLSAQPGDEVALPLAINLDGAYGDWQSNTDATGSRIDHNASPDAFRQDVPDGIDSMTVELDAGQLNSPDFPFADGGAATTVATVIDGGINHGYAVFEGLIVRPDTSPKDIPLHFTVRWTREETP